MSLFPSVSLSSGEVAVVGVFSALASLLLKDLLGRFRPKSEVRAAEAQVEKTEAETMAATTSAMVATFTAITKRMEGEIGDLRARLGRLEEELSASKEVIRLVTAERDRLVAENANLRERHDLLLGEHRQLQQLLASSARVFGQEEVDEDDGMSA